MYTMCNVILENQTTQSNKVSDAMKVMWKGLRGSDSGPRGLSQFYVPQSPGILLTRSFQGEV